MSPRDRQEPMLERLLDDARNEAPAELDWARLEARLMRDVRSAEGRTRSTRAPRSASSFVWATAAAVVLIGGGLWLGRSGGAPSTSPQEPQATHEASKARARNGDELLPGARVEADAAEVDVEHAGRARWTLVPGSSAELREKGERITLRLARGRVVSHVTPNPKPETFVVEALGTRVAVHGTVFSVAVVGERVVVEVSEGTVAVGPLGEAAPFRLHAPAHGDFAADGASGNVNGSHVPEPEARASGAAKPSVQHPPSAAAEGSPEVAVTEAELPTEPSISDIEAGVAPIVEAASACFRSHTQRAEGVELTVRTAISLTILGSGAISSVDFQPPLSPEAEACASANIAKIVFARSKQGARVTRLLELKP